MQASPLKASIITIGDELLIGQTIDTNSAWMAQELNQIGLVVHRRVAVGDQWESIWKALDEESKEASVILLTGGLGPTADDITKPLLCSYFNGKLVLDPGALANVKQIFEQYLKRPLLDRNLRQAEVPDVCTVIPNTRGTAPGMWFEKNGVIYVSMPGVPHEMKGMMVQDVLPRLQERFHLRPVIHRTLITAGIGESFLAEKIKSFEEALPGCIKLAYLPNYGLVKLRLTLTDTRQEWAEKLDLLFLQLKQAVDEFLVAEEDITLQEVVGRLLSASGKTLGTAESCTGGYIAHLITSIPGSSTYYRGSVISYSNDLKQQLLKVPASTLQQEGAVSEDTVRAMCAGCLEQLQADYAIATSGIMGPDGGSREKPVGSVWIAAGTGNKIITRYEQFRFDRTRNIQLTANASLNLLRKLIVENG